MAEGAPYWDSKFLAQFLRRQPSFDVRSIHMLTQERFYSINTGEETGAKADGESIPSSLEDFLRFDMVILGKGAERIITPARARRPGFLYTRLRRPARLCARQVVRGPLSGDGSPGTLRLEGAVPG